MILISYDSETRKSPLAKVPKPMVGGRGEGGPRTALASRLSGPPMAPLFSVSCKLPGDF